MSWQNELAGSIQDTGTIARRFGLDPTALAAVAQAFPVSISPYYWRLIEQVDDPIARQCLPDPRELLPHPHLLSDPLGEEKYSPVTGLVHRYKDRVVLFLASTCPTYCRFCTRKTRVGTTPMAASGKRLTQAISYIAEQPAVTDVILSGGDPLMLDDEQLEDVLRRLRAIPHVEILRIGSRMPVTLPSRITAKTARMLGAFGPVFINLHFNHPRELTPQVAQACRLLAEAGLVLGNQTVLLRGVNDDVPTLKELFKGLLRLRVRPYYLHQMDLTRGTAHFRTSLEKGLQLMDQLRGPVSGLALPHYMIDLPGGAGKVPLLPTALQRSNDGCRIKAPNGQWVPYPDKNVRACYSD